MYPLPISESEFVQALGLMFTLTSYFFFFVIIALIRVPANSTVVLMSTSTIPNEIEHFLELVSFLFSVSGLHSDNLPIYICIKWGFVLSCLSHIYGFNSPPIPDINPSSDK